MSITMRDTSKWSLGLKECIPQHANPQADDFRGGAEETLWSSYTAKWNTQVFLGTSARPGNQGQSRVSS